MKKIIYTAIVLDPTTALNTFLPNEDGWKKFCHHQTIKFGDQELPLNLGQEVEVQIVGYYKDEHAVAVRTADGGHITVATKDVPPKYSNELISDPNNFIVNTNIRLKGRVGAFVVNDDDTASWVF